MQSTKDTEIQIIFFGETQKRNAAYQKIIFDSCIIYKWAKNIIISFSVDLLYTNRIDICWQYGTIIRTSVDPLKKIRNESNGKKKKTLKN